jgi:prepilin-type N-terminal cleavage/methylation domain-containing protein
MLISCHKERGFTLIELSIVLVIIGLIVGGVLVGQDLIRAASIRATISQVEQFNTAVNTFFGKYNALPGDMNYSVAANYGFEAVDLGGHLRGANGVGSGNGDGLIDGAGYNGAVGNPLSQVAGETGMFWSDLTYANGMNLGYISGSFNTSADFYYSFSTYQVLAQIFNQPQYLPQYFPAARLGNSNFFYVYESGGTNYYGLSAVGNIFPTTTQILLDPSNPGMTVIQAYNIDKKIDDGQPMAGNVQVNYLGTPDDTTAAIMTSPSAATGSYTSTTCYNSTTGAYATDSKLGGMCALSFKFQGGT